MPVGVLICSSTEWRAAKRQLGLPEAAISRFPYGEHARLRVAGRSCVLFHCRRTRVRAAGACQYAIDRWRVDPVIVLGTAGGVAVHLEVGDLVLATETVQRDCADQRPGMGAHSAADLAWLALPPSAEPLHRGAVSSADQDLAFEHAAPLRAAGILCADWESAAVAAVCAFNGVRWAIFRGISDVPHAAGDADYQRQLADYARNTPAIMEKLLGLLPAIVAASARRRAAAGAMMAPR
jgi:adenosylhomocysteine nucleosidase